MFFGMNTLKCEARESANLECVRQDIVISREYLFLLEIEPGLSHSKSMLQKELWMAMKVMLYRAYPRSLIITCSPSRGTIYPPNEQMHHLKIRSIYFKSCCAEHGTWRLGKQIDWLKSMLY